MEIRRTGELPFWPLVYHLLACSTVHLSCLSAFICGSFLSLPPWRERLRDAETLDKPAVARGRTARIVFPGAIRTTGPGGGKGDSPAGLTRAN
jgi:hypothetical protein